MRPLSIFENYPKYQATFKQLGSGWEVNEQLFISVMYGRTGYKDINKHKYMLLKKKCKSFDNKIKVNQSVDFNRLPPCRGALRQHINRTNYTVKI